MGVGAYRRQSGPPGACLVAVREHRGVGQHSDAPVRGVHQRGLAGIGDVGTSTGCGNAHAADRLASVQQGVEAPVDAVVVGQRQHGESGLGEMGNELGVGDQGHPGAGSAMPVLGVDTLKVAEDGVEVTEDRLHVAEGVFGFIAVEEHVTDRGDAQTVGQGHPAAPLWLGMVGRLWVRHGGGLRGVGAVTGDGE